MRKLKGIVSFLLALFILYIVITTEWETQIAAVGGTALIGLAVILLFVSAELIFGEKKEDKDDYQ